MEDAQIGGGVAFREGIVGKSTQTGRFMPTQKLTEKQEAFCIAIVSNGGDAVKAASTAGYADRRSAYDLQDNLAVQTRIRQLQTKRISGSMSNKALDVLDDIMSSPAYPAAARVSAAKTVLEMGGHGIVAQGQRLRYGLDTEGKGLEEMTTSELEAFVARQRGALDTLEDVTRSNSAPVLELEA